MQSINKRGFTLTETLGVIVILAIVLGIVSVAFIYVNDSVKTTYYKGVEESLYTAGGEYFTYNRGFQPKVFGNVSKVKVSELVDSKYISEVVGRGNNTCNLTDSYVGAYKDSYDKTNYFVCLICDDYKSDACNLDIGYNLQIRKNIKDTSEIYQDNTWVADYVTLTFETINDIDKVYVKKGENIVKSCDLIDKDNYKTCKIEISETGIYKAYGEAENGNKTNEEELNIKIDSVEPSFEIYDYDNNLISNSSVNYKMESDKFIISGSVSDIIDNDSGIQRIRYRLGDEYIDVNPNSLSFEFQKEVSSKGSYNLSVEITDNAGNTASKWVDYYIYYETPKPDDTYCKNDLVYDGYSHSLVSTTSDAINYYNYLASDAGFYDVTARLSYGYLWDDGTSDPVIIRCEIKKRPITITARDQTVNSSDEISKTISDVTSFNLVYGHSITDITLTEGLGVITPSDAVIKTGGGTTVTNNYDIEYLDGNLVVYSTEYCGTFKRNGASLIDDSTSDKKVCCMVTSGSSCQITTPNITAATNFEVLGWSSVGANATDITNQVESNVTLTNDKTFYAITRSSDSMIVSYSIEFNLNGADSYSIQGTKYSETQNFICRTQYAYNGGSIPTTCTFTLPTITRSGGNVYGWDLDENNQGTPTYSGGQSITVSSDMVLNAITSKNIVLSYDGNGGVTTLENQTVEVFNTEEGAWITIPAYDNANMCRSKTSEYHGFKNIGLITATDNTEPDYCQGKTYWFDKSTKLYGFWKRTYGTGTIATNSKCLYIRKSASTSSDDLACVDKAEKVYLTEKTGNWYGVIFGSVKGYSYASYIDFQETDYAKDSCEYSGYTCGGKDYVFTVSPNNVTFNLYKNETSYQLTIDSQCGSVQSAVSENSKVSVTTSGLITVDSNAVAVGETLTTTLTFTTAGQCTDTVDVTVKNINEVPPVVNISVSGTKYSDGYKSGAVATITCESEEGIKAFTAKDNTGDTGSLSTDTSTKRVRKITLSSASSSRKITASCTSTNGLTDTASKTVKIYVNSASSKCGSGTYSYSGSCSCNNSNTGSEYGEICNANIYAHGSCSNWCKNYQASDGSSYTYKSGTCTRITTYPTCWHT